MTGPNNRHLSRRVFLRSTGAVAATSIAMPFVMRSALAQQGQVVFAGLGGSTQRIFEESIIPKFTQATGYTIQYVPTTPNAMVAKLRVQRGASGTDVIQLAGSATYGAIDDGLLQKIDQSQIPNATRIDPKIAREPQIIPFSVSGMCIIYQKPLFAKNGWAAPADWLDLWDPKYAGHTGAYGMDGTGGTALLLQVAKQLSGDYTKLDPAFAKFRELRKTIYQFFDSAGAWETAWQQGDVWLAVNSYTRGLQFTQAKMPVGVVFPKSGIPSYDVNMGIVANAPNTKGAHAWINFLLNPEIQSIIIEKIGYAPSTLGVKVPDGLENLLPPPDLVWFPDWRKVSAQFTQIVDRWQREVER
jgi:putative spermidine/putrescine transport system substrate-binding protein